VICASHDCLDDGSLENPVDNVLLATSATQMNRSTSVANDPAIPRGRDDTVRRLPALADQTHQ